MKIFEMLSTKPELKVLVSSLGSSLSNYTQDIEEFDSSEFTRTIPRSAPMHHVGDHILNQNYHHHLEFD